MAHEERRHLPRRETKVELGREVFAGFVRLLLLNDGGAAAEVLFERAIARGDEVVLIALPRHDLRLFERAVLAAHVVAIPAKGALVALREELLQFAKARQ